MSAPTVKSLAAKPKNNRGGNNWGKWLILLILILSCVAILPLSWNAIQAQRAQQKTMKAMQKSIREITAALKTERCRADVLAPANALETQARSIETVFPRLSQAPGDFAKLSHQLMRSSDAFTAQATISTKGSPTGAGCQALRLQLPELKKRCEACHELFHPQPKLKVE